MGKLDELMKTSGGHAAESVARRELPAIHRASPPTPASSTRLAGVSRSKGAAEIPTDRISPDPDQPRQEFDDDDIEHLAGSIRARGVLQPIRVRWDEGRSMYIVICGERRWRASQRAGLATVPCNIVEGQDDPDEILIDQLVENLLRADLKPIEQAKGFRALMDRKGWSTRDVASHLSIAQPSVVRALALLDLPASVQSAVASGELAPSVAYELSKIDDAEAQTTVAEQAVAGGMNRAEVVREVQRRASRTGGKKSKAGPSTYRTSGGLTITLNPSRGKPRVLSDAEILAALEEVVSRLRETIGPGVEQAA